MEVDQDTRKKRHDEIRLWSSFRKGLGRMLLFWFLFQSLIPVTFIVVISRYLHLDDPLRIIITIMLGTMLLSVLLLAITTSRRIVAPLLKLSKAAEQVAAGNLECPIAIDAHGEIGDLAGRFHDMVQTLKKNYEQSEEEAWLKNGHAELSAQIRGEQEFAGLCRILISFLARYLDAQIGALYLMNDEGILTMEAGFACSQDQLRPREFALGEGLVGQAALEKKMVLLTHVPEHYSRVTWALGEALPNQVVIAPILTTDRTSRDHARVLGVIELGTLQSFLPVQLAFLEQTMVTVSIALCTAISRGHVDDLLQQREEQARALQNQQDTLRKTNEKLEKRTLTLEMQRDEIRDKNMALEKAHLEIERKARELEIASRYKTEFLANMSH
ncbi:MAG: GAF domain-containing protein, partial [Planctomycetota bacterium]